MTTVRVFDSSPVYVAGLVAVLGRHGVSAAASTGVVVGGLSGRADALVVNPAVVVGTGLPEFVATAGRPAPVLLIVDSPVPDLPGVRGWVHRDAPEDVVVAAVTAVAAGGTFQPGAGREPGSGDARGLSPRERQVLHHIAEGLTQSQIASRLAISHHTVDTYIRRIRAKLELGNKAELTRAALLGAS
jgi:DNA-binding CsgD family transcriptional regulator